MNELVCHAGLPLGGGHQVVSQLSGLSLSEGLRFLIVEECAFHSEAVQHAWYLSLLPGTSLLFHVIACALR